ncbi:MAG: LTA synthase family protein, partial [Sedimenticolaceae bacterium]
MAVPGFFHSRAGGWVVALGFVVAWYALLQGIAVFFFNVSPNLDAVPRDLAANLLLAAMLYAISRNLRVYLPATAVLLAALHLSNAGKVAILGGPIMPDDFLAVRNLFLLLEGWQLAGAIAIVAIPALLLLMMLAWRSTRTWLILGLAAITVAGVVVAPGVVVASMDARIGNSVWNQRGNYEGRGLLLHLVQESARYLARAGSPPSADDVAAALNRLGPQDAVVPEGDPPQPSGSSQRNVHLIVLESFWDPMELKAAGLSPDPVDPRFRELWRKTGYSSAMSPVFGGYTANAEFEVLCGFPVTEDAVFFEGWLRRDVPCLPRHLGNDGYQTIASHPNVAAFWNRVNAYQRVGFGTYWSEKDFVLDDMNRDFLSDASLYRQVLEKIGPMMASDQPVFSYVLTFFGHLDYPLNSQRPRVIESVDGPGLLDSYANTIYYKSRELMDFLVQL